jgi:thiol-disulfide isomerase/thioredoxin
MSVRAYHFWSPTCMPCQHIKPAIQQLKQDFPEVSWESVNTHDDKKALAVMHNVKMVPTIIVEVRDNKGKVLGGQRASGTDMMGYHRMIRGAIKAVSQLPQ